MKITVAGTAGFCMGVRRAVDMVLDASNRFQGSIFTYGPLIHNPQVLRMLEEKKIFRLSAIPEKGEGIVLIRAHGVPPEDEQALQRAGFQVINATCPRVVRVQAIIRRHAQEGYAAIIVGDEKHPEVVGLLGYAGGRGHTVSSLNQLQALPLFENAVVVAQTTQNTSFYNEIKDWCRVHAPHYRVFDTICGSTEKRQAEIRQLAEKNDAVVVVGGKDSGNTRRLAQIAAAAGKPSLHVEDADEIDFRLLAGAGSIALTAGASTPNWTIMDAYRKIEAASRDGREFGCMMSLFREFLLKTNLMAALGAGSLTYACSRIQGSAQDFNHSLIAMLYVLSMHILNNLFTIRSDRYNHPQRAAFYNQNQVYLWILAILSGGVGLFLSRSGGPLPFLILLIMTLLGLSYNLKILPMWNRKLKIGRIRDIPGSKTVLIVLAWGTVTCLLPALSGGVGGFVSVALSFLVVAGLVFARTAYFDILGIQGDRIAGKETLPILLGEKKSFEIIRYVLWGDLGLLILAGLTDLLTYRAFALSVIPLGMAGLIRFFEKGSLVSGTRREFIIECSLIATGVAAAVI